MNDFTPGLEAQQRSIEAMLDNPELKREILEANPRPICYNEYLKITGGSVQDFGKFIVRLRENGTN